jgi:hypothetical protein
VDGLHVIQRLAPNTRFSQGTCGKLHLEDATTPVPSATSPSSPASAMCALGNARAPVPVKCILFTCGSSEAERRLSRRGLGGIAMRRGRWVLLGASIILLAAWITAAASTLMRSSTERDWAAEARAAVLQHILERAQDPDDVDFATVKVRRTGDADERWVCGSWAIWRDDGTVSPYQDFWFTVIRDSDVHADILEIRSNMFGRDDFLDRDSDHYRACFGHELAD